MAAFPRRATRRFMRYALIALAVLLAAMVAWSFIEPRLLLTSTAVFTSPDVPPEFDRARIAYVSDIHAGSLLGPRRVATIIDKVNSLGADIIILGGDNAGGGRSGAEMFYAQAPRLHAPHGMIAVLGNHDVPAEAGDTTRRLAEDGIVVLRNESARLRRNGGIIRVAGVEDLLTGSPDVAAAAQGISPEGFAILVSHNPDVLPQQLPKAKGAFDLVLSGHTHGGQISLFGLWAPVVPSQYGQRFKGGWTKVEGVPVLVSRGAGVFRMPIRFFAPPEIHLIELRTGLSTEKPG